MNTAAKSQLCVQEMRIFGSVLSLLLQERTVTSVFESHTTVAHYTDWIGRSLLVGENQSPQCVYFWYSYIYGDIFLEMYLCRGNTWFLWVLTE